MLGKKDRVYSFLIIREVEEDGEFEDRFVSGPRFYLHSENLNELDLKRMPPKKRVARILEEIAKDQPKELSDLDAENYFEKSMKSHGFKPVDVDRGIRADFPYTYKFRE